MNPRPLGYERRRHCSTLDSTTPARPARSGSAMCPPGLSLRDPAGSVIFRPAVRFPRCKGSPHDDLLPGRSGAHGAGQALRDPQRRGRPPPAASGRPVIPPSGQRTVRCPGSARAASPRPQFPGLPAINPRAGPGLRASGRSLAITSHGRTPTLTRVRNAGQEHNRLPREILAVICQDIARVQFQVDPRRPTCALSGRPVMHDERTRSSGLCR